MPLVMGSPWVGGYFGSAEVGITTTATLTQSITNRTANYAIGSSIVWNDPAVRESLSRFRYLIIGMWRDWSANDTVSGLPMTLADVVNDVRVRAAVNDNGNIQIYKYTNHMEADDNVSNVSKNDLQDKLDAETITGSGSRTPNDWWARDASGTKTSFFGGTIMMTNITRYVDRDSANNETYAEWVARRNYNEFFSGANDGVWDGAFIDNFFFQPHTGDVIGPSAADWDRDDSNESNSVIAADARLGNVDNVNAYTSLLGSSFKIMGNVDGNNTGDGYLREAEHQNALPQALSEFITRLYPSGGWTRVWEAYKTTIENTIDGMCIFHARNVASYTYQEMRATTCAAWLHNGVVAMHEQNPATTLWYDEWNIDLGAAVDSVPTAAWSNGVWKREYANALVLMNPAGNGGQTVTVGSGWKSFSGTQDPTTNNGATKTTVTLADQGTNYGDGIVLVKT